MTAMRWLIMFVGVSGVRHAPAEAKMRLPTDMRIDRLDGGVLFDLSIPEASVLEKVWRGCSQATSHPTQDTNHPDVSPRSLSVALQIVISHLERTIYAAKGRSLLNDTLIPIG